MITDEENWYKDWYKENEKELMESFIDEFKDSWIEYLDMDRATLEKDDLNYWKVLFCKEQMSEDFTNHCEDTYGNYTDKLKMEAKLE